jgi:hypothetical protein
MEKKTEKHPDLQAMKKQLEAAIGKKIDVPDDLILHLRWPVSAYNYSDGEVVWKSIFLPGKGCVEANLLDVSGSASTDANGSVTFLLSSYLCDAVWLSAPVNLEATVRGTGPVFLTMTTTLTPQQPNTFYYNDLSVTVYAWDANGKPAAGVEFDWRCRLISTPIIQ